MKIQRNSSVASMTPPTDYFTGIVRLDSVFKAATPGRVGGATVTFAPGARTAWHTHPLGQTLIVISGQGWAQQEGRTKELIQPGDIVWFDADERHWHGATETVGMTHIAIAEALDGVSVKWQEQVSDIDYLS